MAWTAAKRNTLMTEIYSMPNDIGIHLYYPPQITKEEFKDIKKWFALVLAKMERDCVQT